MTESDRDSDGWGEELSRAVGDGGGCAELADAIADLRRGDE